MSNTFYNYLCIKIIEYFKSSGLESGKKYNLTFDNEDKVSELYSALKNIYKTNPFTFGSYETIEIPIGDKYLLIAASINGITVDFMTKLRNLISEEQEQFTNRSILFLHSSTLDSLLGGSESLTKAGLPLNIKEIKKDIKEKSKKLKNHDRLIINYSLESFDEDISNSLALFEYEHILKILNENTIRLIDYQYFDLYPDSELDSFDEKEMKERIKENNELFKEIMYSKKYGDIDSDLCDKYDSGTLNKIKNDEEISYPMLKLSLNKKLEEGKLTYIEDKSENISEENIIYWEVPDGETKPKKRKRNFLIFNYENKSEINITLSFDEKVSLSDIKSKNHKILKPEISGKKVKIKIIQSEKKFESLKVETKKIKYEFKFLIVNVHEDYFKDLIGKWTLKNGKIYIKTEEKKIVLNKTLNSSQRGVVIGDERDNHLECSPDEKIKLTFEDSEQDLDFRVKINNNILNFVYVEEKEVANQITGLQLWLLKNTSESNFNFSSNNFISDNKVILGSKEYIIKKELSDLILFLSLEQDIIEKNALYYQKSSDNTLKPIELSTIPEELKDIYQELIKYFKKNKLIPSFAFINDELKELYERYIKTFFDIFEKMDFDNKSLIKELMNIGKIISDKKVYLTPLHPLNILYQLEIIDKLDPKNISINIVKHLKSSNLLPYIYNGEDLYKIHDQNFSMEWKIYTPKDSMEFSLSKEYISSLFSDKLKEFIKHFYYLFNLNTQSPLKINLVNMGSCKEVVIGIFKFIISELNNKSPKDLISIIINIHSENKYLTVFEEINIYKTMKEIEENLDININSKDHSKEDILEIYREKVSFYKKSISEIEYSHLTFYEMDKNLIKISYDSMKNLSTGVSFGGINSTLIPNYIGKVYKNGFGIKGCCDNRLIKLSKLYNTISRVCESPDPYNKNDVIVTSISEDKINELDIIYDKSHWVTFIDPKVDINFFRDKNDSLLIIHYSDQYTVNSGYDAITVTKKTKIYEDILFKELKSNFEENKLKSLSKVLINQFNSINGDWLLKFSRNNNKELPKEKISILSAIKFGLSYLKCLDENAIWVPISLEEVLRVTGSAGLSQNDGTFSKKNLEIIGKCSDDLLFIGIKKIEDKINLSLYPVEVKIGKNDEVTIEKAFEQCSNLINKLNEIFKENTFENKFYRNFLIQILYSTLEKFKVYQFGNGSEWEYLLKDEIKVNLWNGNFTYNNFLKDIIGNFGIFSFKKNSHSRELSLKSRIDETDSDSLITYLLAKFTEEDGYKFVTLEEDIINKIAKNELEKQFLVIKENKLNKKNSNDSFFLDSNSTQFFEDDSKPLPSHQDSELKPGMKIIFGDDNYGAPYIWKPNDTDILMHPNTGIIGTMGTGKTQFTKSLITQLYRERKKNIGNDSFGILIFDYKGDYIKEDFLKETNAKKLDPYHLPFNPLSIFNTDNSKPLLPLHTATTIKETLAKGFKLGTIQEAYLRDLLLEAYEAVGISKSDRNTWNNPAPTFKEVYDLYESKEDIKKDSLYSSLSQLVEYELFEPDRTKVKTLYDLLDSVVVINLNGYDESIQNLIIAMTLDLFYSQMQIKGHSSIEKNLREINKVILVDEADNFLSQNFSSVKKILKEGREFGVGTILSTQFLSHFITVENDYTNYMETWVIHKVAKITNKEVKAILGANSKYEEDEYINQISNLKKHYSLVKSGNRPPKKIKDLAFWELLQNN